MKHISPCGRFRLASFDEKHLEAVVELQQSIMPTRKHWDIDQARSQIMDAAHQGGKNVILVWDLKTSHLVGLGAWVLGENGESFGAPFLAPTEAVSFILVDEIVKVVKTTGARWLRIITSASESSKAVALEQRGFGPIFEFVEFEIDPSKFSAPKIPQSPIELIRIMSSEIDFKKYVDLGNLVFMNVDNSLPITESEAREIWQKECDLDLSQVVVDKSNQKYVGFVVVTPKGYIDSVGVHPDFCGRGIARGLYLSTIEAAKKLEISRLHSVVSSNNVASLRLHQSLGFFEVERRQTWELVN